MRKLFITDFDKEKYIPKRLFPLVRPFWESGTGEWKIKPENLEKWKCSGLDVEITPFFSDADFVLISEPLDNNPNENIYRELSEINRVCAERSIFAYAYISGDFGKVYPKFTNVIYYRLGGFKKQLDKNNKAIFPLISDHLKSLFKRDSIFLRKKKEKPIVGFCGHATYSIPKFLYERLKFVKINGQRALSGDFCFEPLFSSAFERNSILKNVEIAKNIDTNFIYREKYRAGASTEKEKLKTTKEYYNNIVESDYVICLRGGGNFSVRLYETLMMGRIPVFVNTDCLLPLEDEIDWKKHAVWVEWSDRENIAAIITEFHEKLLQEDFIQMQLMNRRLWLEILTLKNFINHL